MSFKASAPGSLMILGEYGVLFQKKALVGAVNQRLSVTLIPRQDASIYIDSELGQYHSTIQALQVAPPFEFILTAIIFFQKKICSGFDLKIESDFSATLGLGSSAAVTVATLAVLSAHLNIAYTPEKLIQLGRRIIRTVQGNGSGADVAASVLGGLVAYRAKPFFVEKINKIFPISVLYAGYKTPTKLAIQRVMTQFANRPKLFSRLISAIGACAAEGISAVQQQKWQDLGELMQVQQGLMVALGVSDKKLNELIDQLRDDKNILGAKISGAGLGDCVLGLGDASFAKEAIQLSTTGVICEKI